MPLTASPIELATTVRRARKDAGLDQRELALAAGVSTRTVHNIENAAPGVGISKVFAVLGALGLTLAVETRPVRRSAPAPEPE